MKNYQMFTYIFYFMVVNLFYIFLNFSDVKLIWEWTLYSFFDISISLSLKINYSSMMFLITVFMIFASVYHYSIYYMKTELYVKRFMVILLSFVISMFVLICSGNLFTTLIGWDGLGVSSMMLIMYYCSESSLKASMYTFLMNRLGDCFFLILIFLLFCKFTSLNLFFYTKEKLFTMIYLLFIFMSITKSAQIPFYPWLVKAMEAPTPVSSLVHSSTLVTAGIYILFLYQEVWSNNYMCCYLLSILSLSTMLISSVATLVEMDLKKIIAYSTLTQLGFIMFIFSIRLFSQGFFHLIMHAFFKALMFMSSGYIIYHSSNWQDIRMITLNYSCSPSVVKIMVISIMSLCGMPYLAGFFSKDLILDSLMKDNFSLMMLFMLFTSFIFTMCYSLRLSWYMISSMKSIIFMSDNNTGMIKSMVFLVFMSCIAGSMMLWLDMPFIPMNDSPKIIIYILMFIIVIMFWSLNSKKNFFYFKTNFYLNLLINLITFFFIKYSQKLMWFMDLMNLIGKLIKFPGKDLKKLSKITKMKMFMLNMKDFSFYVLILLLILLK